jgi:hypothetical protein
MAMTTRLMAASTMKSADVTPCSGKSGGMAQSASRENHLTCAAAGPAAVAHKAASAGLPRHACKR